MVRTYRELRRLPTFLDRYRYVKLSGAVGEATFGFDRYLNQLLYTSDKWKRTRDDIIIRDNGCDLAVPGYEIHARLFVHHLNAITIDDIESMRDCIFDPENLVVTSKRTHDAIHFGDEELLPKPPLVRRPNDTCPWR